MIKKFELSTVLHSTNQQKITLDTSYSVPAWKVFIVSNVVILYGDTSNLNNPQKFTFFEYSWRYFALHKQGSNFSCQKNWKWQVFLPWERINISFNNDTRNAELHYFVTIIWEEIDNI